MAVGLRPWVGKARESMVAPALRLNIWEGAVSSSKTTVSMLRYVRWLRDQAPDGTLMLSGKTERTVKENVVRPLREILGRHVRTRGSEVWVAGRRHIIVGATNEGAEAKIRGLTLAGMYGDELTTWPESFFTMALSRLRVEGASFFGTTNPDSPAHWIAKKFLNRSGELDLQRWHFTLDDNPYLPEEYVRQIKLEYTGLWYKRFILGLWCIADGAIYDMLSEALQVQDLPRDLPREPGLVWTVAGVDYGTTNPTVFLALSLGCDGRMYVHHEWRHDSRKAGRQLTMPEQSRAFRAWAAELPQPPEKVCVDPSANALILQLWRDGVRHIVPADNEVLHGIQDVSALLGAGKLVFHEPTTHDAWEEHTSYAWDPDETAKGKDVPIKAHDHSCDAVRYAIRGSRLKWQPLLRTA